MLLVNVLVADDSAFMRKMIASMLSSDPDITVIGTARNGEDTLRGIKKYRPDVVTLDVEMPVMNGLEALKRIMEECPVPVILVSSRTEEGADETLKAMEYGAFDFIPKPSGSISLDIETIKTDLINKVKHAASAAAERPGKPRKARVPDTTILEKEEAKTEDFHTNIHLKTLIAIGVSTGGPKALQKVLPALPKELNAPVLIVQHMPEGFTKSLSSRLNKLSGIRVKEAEDGELLQPGTAYIAPGGSHLRVRKLGASLACELSEDHPVHGHRPSVDVLFESLALLTKHKVIAAILTGMGSDGTKGLIKLKHSVKTLAITESEKTAVVYGMPRAAAEAGVADIVADIDQIAAIIERFTRRG
ncbi:protein-glutamate methylesterase/protein-glutamine glutaminase [Evansella clarkii]|uniref:protein-glutamate methylesterase/protein-glutamine glutaminase n=1 Tax=Evansella clarkii TaxID=79879 RepID=UPI001116C5B6|nr:chemotaxis response regulator protein-glutamate methylesterase [Evansella clarkii]